MNIRSSMYLVLLVFALAVAPAAAQQDLTGTWTGSDASGGTATISFNPDQSFTFSYTSAQGQRTGSSGTYNVGPGSIRVLLYPSGQTQDLSYQMTGQNSMQLQIGQVVFQMTRQSSPQQGNAGGIMGGSGNQQPGGMPNTRPNTIPGNQPRTMPGNQPTNPQNNQGYQDIQHPAGFTFSAPAGWTSEQQQNLLFLVPPDAQQTNQGPAEGALVWAEPNGGLSGPMDPQVESYLNQQMKQIFPYLEPSGKNQTKSGALYMYSGRSPLGLDMVGHQYVKFEGNMAFITLGMSTRDRMQMRDSAFYTMNATSTAGGGQPGMNQGPNFPQQNMPQGQPMPQGQNMPQSQPMPQGQNMPQTQPMPQNQPRPQGQQNPQGTPMPQGQLPGTGGQAGAVDQNLTGFWVYTEEDTWEGGRSADSQGLELRADGSFVIYSKYEYRDADITEGTNWEEEVRGTWSASGNQLSLSADGETLTWRYQFSGGGITFWDESGEAYQCVRGQSPGN